MHIIHHYFDKFFDFSEASESKAQDVHSDFIWDATWILTHCPEIGVKEADAKAIANCLFARMSAKNLHYHTPVHILSIFEYAKTRGFSLKWWEQIALWFHDAIYVPDAPPGKNEVSSANFAEALLELYIEPVYLIEIRAAICSTAYHLQKEVAPKHDLIMDLDLSSFLATQDVQDTISSCIQKEAMTFMEREIYQKARIAFFEQLLRRKSLFRSNEFRPFNADAVKNIKRQIRKMVG